MSRVFTVSFTALATCAAAATFVSPAIAITTAPSWLPRETVSLGISDTFDQLGADRSLAYDHYGNPGIAFSDEAGDNLRFARRVPGLGWVNSIVDDGGGTNHVGIHPSLAFDRYERPAISYFDVTAFNLKYAHFDGTDWIVETTADSADALGEYTSLAFDNLGRAAVAYHDNTSDGLKYVRDTDGDGSLADETPVVVSNVFDDGFYSSLVFDSLNRPMIAHQDNTNFDLRFSMEEPGIGWVTTTLDSTGDTGYLPSIDINPDTGYPAIAYYDGSQVVLRFAEWNGTSWDLTTVDNVNLTGAYPSLAYDPADGNPAISYYEATNGDLMLAWHDGVSWQTQTVDDAGNVGFAPSIAFNDFGDGFPSIAYFEEAGSGTDNLYFIEDPLPVPEPATLWLLMCGAFALAWIRRPLNGER